MTDRDGPRANDAGFTLIEVVVALALFALISLAGLALVDTVLDVEHRTAGRLERLGDLERAMFVVGRDLEGIADAPLAGTAAAVAFVRRAADGRPVAVRYALAGTTLERVADGRPQAVLDGVTAVRWHYYAVPRGWQPRWPGPDGAAAWPLAVALDLTLPGRFGGTLRRVVDLPVRPRPSGAHAP